MLLLDDPNRTPHAVAVNASGTLADDAAAQPGAVHGGARRLVGGVAALVDTLAEPLPAGRVRLGAVLDRMVDRGDHVELHLHRGTRADVVTARHVVLAMPPRVAEAVVGFEPRLPDELIDALRATPTWMECGRAIATLTREMQGADELFASKLTLRAVEAQLLIMAHTLGNVTLMLHKSLAAVDWNGWAVLHYRLRRGIQPRREEVGTPSARSCRRRAACCRTCAASSRRGSRSAIELDDSTGSEHHEHCPQRPPTERRA
ncbi:MAG: FAD-dependent oxidoreductase [Burkholderiales bacterium]